MAFLSEKHGWKYRGSEREIMAEIFSTTFVAVVYSISRNLCQISRDLHVKFAREQ